MEQIQSVEKMLRNARDLPTLPGIALRILEVIHSESEEVKDFADVMASDPSMSAKVLQLVNSPLYGLNREITNVFHAVNLLGMHVVRNLALSFSLVDNFETSKIGGFDYSWFWKHSLICALTSRMLVHKTDGLSAEDAFFLGLIHDLGILAFIHSMPAQYDVVMQHVRNSDYEFHEVEKMFLGITHMEMGYYLFQKWGFPEKFVVPICYHHDPEMIPQEKKHFSHNSQVLHFASMLSTFLYGANTTVSFSLVDYYFKTYGLDAQYDIEKIITQLQDQTSSIFPIFDVSLDEEYDYLSILEEARNYLITNSNEMTLYILEQKRNIDQLERLAFYDELTGLINYRKFFDLLEKELARAKRYDSYFCLCLSDIDLFKRVNDSYGHIVGDKVLKQVAGYLCDNLRMCDTIARYGGEEFAFIIPETHCEEALVVVERLREGISRSKFRIQGNSISLTMSFGLAEFKPDHDLSGEDVLSQADSALYDSKRSGRNRSAVYKPVYSMQEPHLENNAYGPKVL